MDNNLMKDVWIKLDTITDENEVAHLRKFIRTIYDSYTLHQENLNFIISPITPQQHTATFQAEIYKDLLSYAPADSPPEKLDVGGIGSS